MTQLTDLDAPEASAKPNSGYGSVRNGPPKRGFVEQSPHKEILALVPRLTRYARVLTRDVAAADDLVQDCLTRALGKIHLWEQGTDLRAWLFTIMYRQYISHARRDARHGRGVELSESGARLALSPNQTARLELRDLERCLARLPEEQRSVILLVGLEGMEYEEAASIVKTPVGTVRSRVARGREALRELTGLFPTRHSGRLGKAAYPGSSPRPARKRASAARPNGAILASKSQEVVQ
jgi:RNA polymerase sigma-70 factor (ECF subfamily)